MQQNVSPKNAAKFSCNKGTQLLDEMKDVNGAILELSKAIALDNTIDNIASFTARGRAYLQKGQMASALKDFSEAIRLKPTSGGAHYNRASAYQTNEQWSLAADDYQKSALLFSDQGAAMAETVNNCKKQAMYCLGHALMFEKNDIEAALEQFSKATTSYPNDPWCWRALGLAKYSKGDHEGAIMDFSTAIRLNPRFYQALFLRGKAYMEKNGFANAANDFDAVVMLAVGDPTLQNDAQTNSLECRTAHLITSQDYDGLIALYTKLISVDANTASHWFQRGYGYFWKGQYDRCVADETEAIRLKSDYADAYQQRAMAYQGINNLSQAADDFDKAAGFHTDKDRQEKCKSAARALRSGQVGGSQTTDEAKLSTTPTAENPASTAAPTTNMTSGIEAVTQQLQQTKLASQPSTNKK